MYHIIKMIPNRIFFTKVFGSSDLRYIFAVRKGGAIVPKKLKSMISIFSSILEIAKKSEISAFSELSRPVPLCGTRILEKQSKSMICCFSGVEQWTKSPA
jgi:hypothetical protein